jgi:hypothetical protein
MQLRIDGPELPQYVSHKRVWALEIAEIGQRMENGYAVSFRDAGYDPVELPYEMWARYKPVPGDFYVVYADGYKSFSPRKAFLEGYTREGA